MNPSLLDSITSKKSQLDRLRPFPKAVLGRLHQQIVVEWTFNSNAIEGNTLTLKETALILQEGLTISGKPLREHFETINHKDAIQFLENVIQERQPLDENFVFALHKLILKGIADSESGVYRRHAVRILGAVHIPPNPLKVPALMGEFFREYRRERKKMHPVKLAAWLHHRFVAIHPFIDGNGRTARLLMNFVLMQSGYPPAVILKVDRRKYYRVLKEADAGKQEAYVDFIGRSVERSLVIYIQALTPSSRNQEKQGYISLAEAAEHSPYSQEYLSLLARRGILPAVKFGRNWMTTLDAVKEYVEAQNKGG